jgi:hypothetical protein
MIEQPYERIDVESAYAPNVQNLQALLWSSVLCVLPHERNSDIRRYVTVIMIMTWCVVTASRSFGITPSGTNTTAVYWAFTVVGLTVFAHMWGFEYGVLASEE